MELVYVRDPREIEKCTDFVWSMCQESYQPIGGFLSIKSKEDFPNRVDLLKLVLVDTSDGTTAVCACGLYRDINGGFKGIGFASNKDVSSYKTWVKLIIRDDIAKFSEWYWTEASHGIGKWFNELGGYAIPNIYVPEILAGVVSEDDLCEDGFTYRRLVGPAGHKVIIEKQMYGFANQEAYEKIMSEYGGMGKFVDYLDEHKPNWNVANERDFDQVLSEAAELPSYKMPKLVTVCVGYIYNLDEFHVESDAYEVPQKWLDNLEYAMTVLKQYVKQYPVKPVVKAIGVGEDLQKQLTPLVLHRFGHIEPPPHTTI